jgi:copper transport protein
LKQFAFLGALVLTLIIPASPAGAHASLLQATPAAGYSVSESPAALTLMFDEPVSVREAPLRLSGPGGDVPLGASRLADGGRQVAATVLRRLGRGQYQVSW